MMNETRLIGSFFKPRQKAIAQYATQAEAIQNKVLRQLVNKAEKTEWGLAHDYQSINQRLCRPDAPRGEEYSLAG